MGETKNKVCTEFWSNANGNLSTLISVKADCSSLEMITALYATATHILDEKELQMFAVFLLTKTPPATVQSEESYDFSTLNCLSQFDQLHNTENEPDE